MSPIKTFFLNWYQPNKKSGAGGVDGCMDGWVAEPVLGLLNAIKNLLLFKIQYSLMNIITSDFENIFSSIKFWWFEL